MCFSSGDFAISYPYHLRSARQPDHLFHHRRDSSLPSPPAPLYFSSGGLLPCRHSINLPFPPVVIILSRLPTDINHRNFFHSPSFIVLTIVDWLGSILLSSVVEINTDTGSPTLYSTFRSPVEAAGSSEALGESHYDIITLLLESPLCFVRRYGAGTCKDLLKQ